MGWYGFGKSSLEPFFAKPPKSLAFLGVGKQLTSMTCLDLCSPNSQVVCVALERGYDVLNAIQRDQPDP